MNKYLLTSFACLTLGVSFASGIEPKISKNTITIQEAKAFAESSNRNKVRSKLSQGWQVVWGHNFTEGDWVEGLGAISTSVAAENPGPFLKWFNGKVEQNWVKINQNFPDISKQFFKQMLVQSLREKKVIFYKNLDLDAGFATYDRWKRVVYHEPRTRRCGWRKLSICPYTAKVEKKSTFPTGINFMSAFVQDVDSYNRPLA